MCDVLRFDAIFSFKKAIEGYGWKGYAFNTKRTDDSNFFQAEVLCRITSLVQAVLTLAVVGTKQILRGFSEILIGLFICKPKLMLYGALDFVAVAIQAIVLPILGLAATIMPSLGMIFCGSPNTTQSSEHPQIYPEELLYNYNITGIGNVIYGITAPIQAILNVVYGFSSALLRGEVGQETLLFPVVLLAAPAITLLTSFDDTLCECSCSTVLSDLREEWKTPLVHGFNPLRNAPGGACF